jgi:hypothetical protein
VVIDAATRRQVGGLFTCRDLGPFELKGLPGVVPAWHVLSAGATDSRFEALRRTTTPLIGREEELELLLRRWAALFLLAIPPGQRALSGDHTNGAGGLLPAYGQFSGQARQIAGTTGRYRLAGRRHDADRRVARFVVSRFRHDAGYHAAAQERQDVRGAVAVG